MHHAILFSLTILCLSLLSARAIADPASTAPKSDALLTLNVWPAQPPGDNSNLGPEKWSDTSLTKTDPGVTDVTTPTLALYRPAPQTDTGAAVLICPGGGFSHLAYTKEGVEIAHWMNSIGVTAVVLKYRVPARPNEPRYLAAVQDAQRAMCIIRSKAADWNIDPHRLGAVGFSAGGQVVAFLSTNFDKLSYASIDDTDKQSTRPDFVLAIYPAYLSPAATQPAAPPPPPNASPILMPNLQPTSQSPPTFIVMANDDRIGSENAAYYYLALKHAHVSAELHIYSDGGHGFGIRPSTQPHATWPDRAVDWMKSKGVLTATTKK